MLGSTQTIAPNQSAGGAPLELAGVSWFPSSASGSVKLSGKPIVKELEIVVSPVRKCIDTPCSTSTQNRIELFPKDSMLRAINLKPNGSIPSGTQVVTETTLTYCKLADRKELTKPGELDDYLAGSPVQHSRFSNRFNGAVIFLKAAPSLFGKDGELLEMRQTQRLSVQTKGGEVVPAAILHIVVKGDGIEVGVEPLAKR